MNKHKVYAIIAALIAIVASIYGLNCIAVSNMLGYWLALFNVITFGLMSIYHIQSYFNSAYN